VYWSQHVAIIYHYRPSAEAGTGGNRITVERAAIALAALSGTTRTVVAAKKESGELYNRDGSIYPTLFHPGVSGIHVSRAVRIHENLDNILASSERAETDYYRRMFYRHGRFFILHVLARRMRSLIEKPESQLTVSDQTELSRALLELAELIYTAAEARFNRSKGYLAIFRNLTDAEPLARDVMQRLAQQDAQRQAAQTGVVTPAATTPSSTVAPDGSEVYPIHDDGKEARWSMAMKSIEEMKLSGDLIWKNRGTEKAPKWIPYTREYAPESPQRPHPTIWNDLHTTRQAKAHQKEVLPEVPLFDTPKPEPLIQRILEMTTNPGDLVLDSFLGSGTTAAVAHKMGRRWIGIELGEHCHTHCIPRLSKVIDGEDAGGITEAAGWKGGGGFRYYKLAPSLLTQDKWGQWVISKEYNAPMLAEAVCKHENFTYAPSDTVYWQQGRSTERDFIYTTTATLSHEQLQELSDEVGPERTLLVVCSAFRGRKEGYPNLTIKKIPAAVLTRCEWGHDDYSLKVENLPKAPPSAPKTDAKTGQQSLFGDETAG
jgi:hypothetical protein